MDSCWSGRCRRIEMRMYVSDRKDVAARPTAVGNGYANGRKIRAESASKVEFCSVHLDNIDVELVRRGVIR